MASPWPVRLDVIIPTLGERRSLHDVIATLARMSAHHLDLQLRIFVSMNVRDHKRQVVELSDDVVGAGRIPLKVIGPDIFQTSAERHLLWCLKWYAGSGAPPDAIVWPLTDSDPLLQAGFDALVAFLRTHRPDMFFVNNLWASTLGEAIPSPAFRANQSVWKGSASLLFRSQGFEHATTNIGSLLIRGGFLTERIIGMFERTLARCELCAHAWWSFEAGSTIRDFYLVTTPILLNKFKPHNFDNAPTWTENAKLNRLPAYHDWTIGYLRHLLSYIEDGILTFHELRSAMISEPQRGIVPFMDDLLRRVFMQAQLALRRPAERFAPQDLEIIRSGFVQTYPSRAPMIDDLCVVLSSKDVSPRERLHAYKRAWHFKVVEDSFGPLSVLFRNAHHGYYIYEHPQGYAATLVKGHAQLAFRDVDATDMYPLILIAGTEEQLLDKIDKARHDVDPILLLDNSYYLPVELREEEQPFLAWPRVQMWVLTQPLAVQQLSRRLVPVNRVKRVMRKVRRYLHV